MIAKAATFAAPIAAKAALAGAATTAAGALTSKILESKARSDAATAEQPV